ncbi:MAG: TRAP transporter small permease subunit, partial [Rickettsiales bacterium]
MEKLALFCETLNRRVGRAIAWLSLFTVLMMFANVLLRYLFNSGAPWQVEVVLFAHAITFLSLMGYTMQEGEQVRVDVFYSRFSDHTKAWVDALGTLVLLFPLCLSLIYFSFSFVESSWSLREASSEYDGMPGIWVLKTFLLIAPMLLTLQGFAT